MDKQRQYGSVGTESVVPARELAAVGEGGAAVAVPDPERLIHLQFRRFAGCPVCNLHLQSIVRRHDEITAAGVTEVVVFHSSAEELRKHVEHLPFAVVADPDKLLYREFGVESAPRALLDPRAWWPILRAVAVGIGRVIRGKDHLPAPKQPNGRLGLPADFLIAPGGLVVAAKFGTHAYDQWSVDELLELVREKRPAEA
ncbi:MAG: AhpC/TSA family protein [Streptomycetaceae bacterium]|nr:AhpC/TSA family protein [Streptomycetaceae bacterium]